MTPHITTQQKALIFRLQSQGKSLRRSVLAQGCARVHGVGEERCGQWPSAPKGPGDDAVLDR